MCCDGCNLLGKLAQIQPDSCSVLPQLQLDCSDNQEGLLHVFVRYEHIRDLATGIHLKVFGFKQQRHKNKQIYLSC